MNPNARVTPGYHLMTRGRNSLGDVALWYYCGTGEGPDDDLVGLLFRGRNVDYERDNVLAGCPRSACPGRLLVARL